ncbi:unnamed protein product [Oppiella nova]|uniref:EGF-like domain-containing protein n=1 Tax=Oppiella nova TaxID=334625 RepID=A0A7R9M820_9ACAR|nr:unnamed protein product [Oppiella nova]CAG2171362.1 unnamed protein product [Oppiella nova]
MPSDDSDRLPVCFCPLGFDGLRCENLVLKTPDFDSRESYSLDATTKWILIAVIPVAIVLILFLVVFIGVFTFRIRKSNRAFLHRRMQESGANVEISNPMFGGDDFDDDLSPSHALSRTFALEVNDKSTNFANPLYEFQQNTDEEKRNLLIADNEVNSNDESKDVYNDSEHPLA